jgi:hypothetical protein
LTLAQREEIARPRPASVGPLHRCGDQMFTVDGVAGAAAQRRPAGRLPGYHRARPGLCPGVAAKLVTNLVLRGKVEADLAKKYSPEQIAGRLKLDFPNQPEMQVSTETIYQSLYVQSRGALKRDLTRYLRTGRAVRRPSRKVGQRKNRIPNMINIAERVALRDVHFEIMTKPRPNLSLPRLRRPRLLREVMVFGWSGPRPARCRPGSARTAHGMIICAPFSPRQRPRTGRQTRRTGSASGA